MHKTKTIAIDGEKIEWIFKTQTRRTSMRIISTSGEAIELQYLSDHGHVEGLGFVDLFEDDDPVVVPDGLQYGTAKSGNSRWLALDHGRVCGAEEWEVTRSADIHLEEAREYREWKESQGGTPTGDPGATPRTEVAKGGFASAHESEKEDKPPSLSPQDLRNMVKPHINSILRDDEECLKRFDVLFEYWNLFVIEGFTHKQIESGKKAAARKRKRTISVP